MKKTDIEKLEKVTGQLEGLHSEISSLAKKSPNDALNKFKLGFVNTVLSSANAVLGNGYKPFADFAQFDTDDVPTNSDVTMILAQYLEEMERKRADNIKQSAGYWVYVADPSIRTSGPRKIIMKK
jgi:hypothetical protein